MKKVKWLVIATVALTILIVPVAYLAHAQKPTQTAVQAPVSVPLNATTIFTLVNAERAKNSLNPLVRDARLDSSAQTKADDMVNNNYFGHVDANGKHGYELISLSLCSKRSENLSIMYDESGDNNADTVIGWMNSKPHREAILNPEYTLTGVAVSGNKVVQHFCIAR